VSRGVALVVDTGAMVEVAFPPNQQAPSSPRRFRLVAGLLAAVVVLAAIALALGLPRTTVVRTSSQPAGVVYPTDRTTHVAVLRHVRSPMAAVGLGADHYEVVLGRDPSGGYGHRVRVEATGADASQFTVEWTTEGAWLAYPTGHRLFVPARSFLHGR
jgi:hypothetical protein